MSTSKLEERKSRALEVLSSFNNEEAISQLEIIAKNLSKRYAEECLIQQPNCFTLEEVEQMLEEGESYFANRGKGIPHEEVIISLSCWE